jgi:DNA (cytosine-5)-methyltransferase 1
MKRVLNLYAGLGGNRALWRDCSVTAVEFDPEIAAFYQTRFANDTVVVADAHEYLEQHYREFDFIWSSPPCQSHASFRQNISVRFRGTAACYPDMRLYQEIIFLQANASGFWAVENVNPYYEPLINPTAKVGRHLIWSNFEINSREFKKEKLREAQIPQLERHHGIDLKTHRIKNKRQILRNCVDADIGSHLFECAFSLQKEEVMPLFRYAGIQ